MNDKIALFHTKSNVGINLNIPLNATYPAPWYLLGVGFSIYPNFNQLIYNAHTENPFSWSLQKGSHLKFPELFPHHSG